MLRFRSSICGPKVLHGSAFAHSRCPIGQPLALHSSVQILLVLVLDPTISLHSRPRKLFFRARRLARALLTLLRQFEPSFSLMSPFSSTNAARSAKAGASYAQGRNDDANFEIDSSGHFLAWERKFEDEEDVKRCERPRIVQIKRIRRVTDERKAKIETYRVRRRKAFGRGVLALVRYQMCPVMRRYCWREVN